MTRLATRLRRRLRYHPRAVLWGPRQWDWICGHPIKISVADPSMFPPGVQLLALSQRRRGRMRWIQIWAEVE